MLGLLGTLALLAFGTLLGDHLLNDPRKPKHKPDESVHLKVTFNELVIAIPTGLLLFVIAVMILDRQMDKILKKDREQRRDRQE